MKFTLLLAAAAAAQSPLGNFLAPQEGVFAANADLITPVNVSSIEECANLCLNYTGPSYSGLGCIHFNICTTDAPYRCGIGGFNRTLIVVPGSTCSYYQRIRPRNDAPFKQAVPWQLDVPTRGVTLNGGLLSQLFDSNVVYLTTQFSVDNLLYNFRKRAGLPQPPGAKCQGWDCTTNWVEGSLAGLFMMGAGNAVRWVQNPVLQDMLDELIDGIANASEASGYIMAFNESALATDEHPDYTLSWTTHGLLDAHIAGNPKALGLIRGMINLFNNHTLLPTFLPPDGGNAPWQEPANPPPPGWNGVNCSGWGTETGHDIYLIAQGVIHNTLMGLSEAGTQADVDLVTQLYEETWWLPFLASGDPASIWQKHWYSHNYQLTAIEAYLDAYVLTGQASYLQAVMSAWNMWRDPEQGWKHVGGSVAINEVQYYAPGSYYLTADFKSAQAQRAEGSPRHTREWVRYLRAKESQQRHKLSHGHTHSIGSYLQAQLDEEQAHSEHSALHTLSGYEAAGTPCDPNPGADWSNHPTGEFCGAVFWLKINQRLHRLYPEVETYVSEIETEVFNEAPAHQGVNGSGIRYFSNLNGYKQEPGTQGTCCEGQGTRLYGSLHEYLFSTPAPGFSPGGGAMDGLLVDLYAPSTFLFNGSVTGAALNATVITQWPYGEAVSIQLTCTAAATASITLDVGLRMPAWAADGLAPGQGIAISINGAASGTGTPGTYYHVQQSLTCGAGAATVTISFQLPMTITAHRYTGVTQLGNGERWAYTVGPILLAAVGPSWNSLLNVLEITGVTPSQPLTFLSPAGDGNALHFNITLPGPDGQPGMPGNGGMLVPLGEIQEQQFSVFPLFNAGGGRVRSE